jgi:hypothetical protein
MLLDLLALNYWLLLSTILGLPFVAPFRQCSRRLLVSPVFGYGFIGVVGTIMYVKGVMPNVIHGVMLAFAGLILLTLVRHFRSVGLSAGYKSGRWTAFVLVLELLLLLPKWIGGIQFSVFQGNHWDQFNYITSALTYVRYPFVMLQAMLPADVLTDPLIFIANCNLSGRPTVMILFSILGGPAAQYLLQLQYTFLVFLLCAVAGAIGFSLYNLACRLRNNKPGQSVEFSVLLLSLAFVAGFWGQYIFDINAWSQLASVAINLALMFFLVGYRLPEHENPLAYFIAVTMLVSASWYFYPESFLYHLAVVLPVLLLVALGGKGYFRRPQVVAALAGIGLGMLTGLFYAGAFQQVMGQFQFGTQSNTEWWQFYQWFLAGRDLWGDALKTILAAHPQDYVGALQAYFQLYGYSIGVLQVVNDVVLGLAGFYFLTPEPTWTPLVKTIVRGLTFSAVVFFAIGWLRCCSRSPYRRLIEPWFAVGLIAVTGVVVLCAKGQFWAAGKAYSYIVVYLFILGSLPLLAPNSQKWLRLMVVSLSLISISFGLGRIGAASNPNGIHWSFPYPSVQVRALKTELKWDMESAMELVRASRMVAVNVDDPWLERQVQLNLTARKIPYYSLNPVNTYYGTGDFLGLQTAKPELADALLVISDQEPPYEVRAIDLRHKPGESEAVHNRRKQDELHRLRERSLSRSMRLQWGKGAYSEETVGPDSWRWTENKVELVIENVTVKARQAVLTFGVSASAPKAQLTVSGSKFGGKTFAVGPDPVKIELPISLVPGKTLISLSTDAPALAAPNDNRKLYLKFTAVSVQEPGLQERGK